MAPLMTKAVSILRLLLPVITRATLALRVAASHTLLERESVNIVNSLYVLSIFSYGSGFVCHGAGSRHDDPFSSPSKKTVQHGHGKVRSINTTPTKRLDQNWRSGSSGGSSGGDSPAHDLKAAQQHQSSGHKGGQFISGQNAQAFYPPSACVFVAK